MINYDKYDKYVDRSINIWIENKQLELAMWSSLISLEKQFWWNGRGKILCEVELGKNEKTEIEKQRKYFGEFCYQAGQELGR